MKRLVPLFLFMLCSLFAVTVQAAETVPSFTHFVVVDAVFPDGTDSSKAVPAFEKEVIKLAGGFTELGPSRGGSLVGETVEYQNNISFVIAADRDISKELKAITTKLFGGHGAFILAWPSSMVR